MAILDGSTENELYQVLGLLAELSDQLSQNRNASMILHSRLGDVKTQAVHNQTGFVLRRFNMDKTKEAYETELERMSTALSAENQSLMYDNKQLNALIKEYEQTLDTVMTTFRNRAYEIQNQELTLIRAYESALIESETETLNQELDASTRLSNSLARISKLLRAVVRKGVNGEDGRYMPKGYVLVDDRDDVDEAEAAATTTVTLEAGSDKGTEEGGVGASVDEDLDEVDDEDEQDRAKAQAIADWALDRECELARLERENEELKRLVEWRQGVMSSTVSPNPGEGPSPVHLSLGGQGGDREGTRMSYPRREYRTLGGAAGTVGPFGTYKRMRGGCPG